MGPNPRTRKMIGMISVILAGYLAVGFAGYVAYPHTVSSNVLKTFPGNPLMQARPAPDSPLSRRALDPRCAAYPCLPLERITDAASLHVRIGLEYPSLCSDFLNPESCNPQSTVLSVAVLT